MAWFIKKKCEPGWAALALHQDHVDLVHVRPGAGGRPEIALCDSFRKEESDIATLTRLRNTLKLDRYRCTTLLASPQYQINQIDAPAVPLAEVRAAVRWRVKDIIDYPIDSATIEVLYIPGDPDSLSREQTLYAVTARNEVIAACVRPFSEARIALRALDIPDLAQRNLAALFESGDGGAAMLAFYEDQVLLTFTRGGELLLSRRIDVRLEDLTQDDAQRREQDLERVALEVQRSLDHFEYQFPYVSISRLLVGPLPRDIGLVALLSSNLTIPVESLDLESVMGLAGVPELKRTENQSQYLPLIGAALRAEEAAAA